MSQRIDPDSDVSNANWVTAPLWSNVDDGVSQNDTDFITAANIGNTCELGLSNPASTPAGSTATLTIRARTAIEGAGDTFTVSLMEGVNIRGTGTPVLTSIFADYTIAGTSISNYNNLTVKLNSDAGDFLNSVDVSWIKVDVPNAGTIVSIPNAIFFSGD